MKYRSSIRSPNSSIASIGAISLTCRGCVCREKSTWDDQHSAFFADNEPFFQNSIFHIESFTHSGASGAPTLKDRSSWVLEDKDLKLCGRIHLQLMTGHFRQGFLMVDIVPTSVLVDLDEVLGQLITSIFISMHLDTLKIIPASTPATLCLKSLCPTPPTQTMSFNTEFLPLMAVQIIHHLDRAAWLESPAGEKASSSLGWLKNRVARSEAMSMAANKEDKRPWLLNLLTFGRRRKKKNDLIHPLHQLRDRFD